MGNSGRSLLSTTLVLMSSCRVQVDISETRTLKGMYFQLVEIQVLSTQGQPDVNLHRLTSRTFLQRSSGLSRRRRVHDGLAPSGAGWSTSPQKRDASRYMESSGSVHFVASASFARSRSTDATSKLLTNASKRSRSAGGSAVFDCTVSTTWRRPRVGVEAGSETHLERPAHAALELGPVDPPIGGDVKGLEGMDAVGDRTHVQLVAHLTEDVLEQPSLPHILEVLAHDGDRHRDRHQPGQSSERRDDLARVGDGAEVAVPDGRHRDEHEPDRIWHREHRRVGGGESRLARKHEASEEDAADGVEVHGDDEGGRGASHGEQQQVAAVRVPRDAQEAKRGERLERAEDEAHRITQAVVEGIGSRTEADAHADCRDESRGAALNTMSPTCASRAKAASEREGRGFGADADARGTRAIESTPTKAS